MEGKLAKYLFLSSSKSLAVFEMIQNGIAQSLENVWRENGKNCWKFHRTLTNETSVYNCLILSVTKSFQGQLNKLDHGNSYKEK